MSPRRQAALGASGGGGSSATAQDRDIPKSGCDTSLCVQGPARAPNRKIWPPASICGRRGTQARKRVPRPPALLRQHAAGRSDSIRALSEFVGHADPGFTVRTYTQLMPTSAERTRDAVDETLRVRPQRFRLALSQVRGRSPVSTTTFGHSLPAGQTRDRSPTYGARPHVSVSVPTRRREHTAPTRTPPNLRRG